MPDNRRIVYWDANVFLAYVNAATDRMQVLDTLLDDSIAEQGTVRVYTAELSRVEVAFGASEQQHHKLDPQVEQTIDNLWRSPGPVTLVEHHGKISQVAKNLIRSAITRGWSLKPFDAIHLATAQWLSIVDLEVEEFQTYDKTLQKYEPLVGFKVIEPYVREPRML